MSDDAKRSDTTKPPPDDDLGASPLEELRELLEKQTELLRELLDIAWEVRGAISQRRAPGHGERVADRERPEAVADEPPPPRRRGRYT